MQQGLTPAQKKWSFDNGSKSLHLFLLQLKSFFSGIMNCQMCLNKPQ